MLRRLALLALAGSVVASSFAAGNETQAVLWPDGGGHAHNDPAAHSPLGFGAELVGHVSLGTPIGEVDVAKDANGSSWVLVALLSGGFALVDGTDPANPVLVSRYTGGGAYGADAKFSDDSNTVFLSLQGGGGASCSMANTPFLPMSLRKETCGVQLFDATDKAAPRFLGTMPSSTGGSHMMDYEVLNGVPTIGMAAQGSPSGIPLAVVPGNKVAVGVGRAEAGSNHDVTLTMDPLQPLRALALVANAGSGVRVYDITDPSVPTLLGQWHPGRSHYMHTVHLTVIDGKRVLMAAEECFFGGTVPCTLWFLDATNFGAMSLLGQWQNPDGRTPAAFTRWSAHNFQLEDGLLYMGHYHGGLVVLDVSSLGKLANPPMVANYLPDKPRCGGCGSFSSDVPFVWDAMPRDGVVWVTDINTGLYAVRLA